MALEVALQTNPNAVLIGEEIFHERRSLNEVVSKLADLVVARSEGKTGEKKNYGVVLVPEGLLTFIPDMVGLLKELDQALGSSSLNSKGASEAEEGKEAILSKISPWNRALFEDLPAVIQKELLLSREIHGTLQLSQIQTEKMVMELVGRELNRRKERGEYSGSYKTMTHFFGYQTRCGFPTEFDCSLGSTLGQMAAVLIANGCTGYLTRFVFIYLCTMLSLSVFIPFVYISDPASNPVSAALLPVTRFHLYLHVSPLVYTKLTTCN